MTAEQKALHRLHLATRTVVVIAATLGFVLALIVYPYVFVKEPFDPLRFPEQQVLSRVPGISGPAARYGQPVAVRGTKCSTVDRPVPVLSTRRWVSDEPQGVTVPAEHGVGVVDGGCTTATFVNEVPRTVLQADTRLRKLGLHPRWRLTAELRPQGKSVVARSWRTEPFALVP